MKYSGRSGGLYIKHITPRLPVDLLLDSEPLTRYFNIRNEINTAQETNRRRRLQPITNHLPQDSQHVTDANMPTVPSTTITRPSAPAAPTEHTVTANGNILDTSKPANIMVWLQVSVDIVKNATIYSCISRMDKPLFKYSVILG
jgi:hypothetical protein